MSASDRSAGRFASSSALPDRFASISSSPYPERQVVVGVDVQPPEQLLAPRRQRLEADGLDVGQRHQAEHLQAFFDADQLGERLDDLRILRVAPERDLRHRAGGWRSGTRPCRARSCGRPIRANISPRHAHALDVMVVVAPLADVVQEQREHEQLRRVEILEQRREALAVRRDDAWRGARGS